MRGSDVLAGLCGQMARSCRKSPLGGAWQCVKASHLRARVRMDPFGTPTVKNPRPETFRKFSYFQLCTDLRPVGQTVLFPEGCGNDRVRLTYGRAGTAGRLERWAEDLRQNGLRLRE